MAALLFENTGRRVADPDALRLDQLENVAWRTS